MKKVLVIEDDEVLRSALLEVLGLEAYEAVGATDGREGVLSAQIYNPHLIICDLMMPVLDGFGVIEELHQDPQTADIPVILLSASTEHNVVQQGLQMGVAAYLAKPYELDELLAIVRTHIVD
jgi:CheY-like chemotaxis protein